MRALQKIDGDLQQFTLRKGQVITQDLHLVLATGKTDFQGRLQAGPAGMPLRLCFAANPGGPSHGDIARRFVFGATPWEVSVDKSTDRQFVLCPSTVVDNPTLDSASYREQLAAACAQDPEILKAWLNGDWAISPGSYFGDVIDEQRNAVDPWPRPKPEDPNESHFWQSRRSGAAPEWSIGLAMDWGSAAPCVTYLVAKSPGGEGPDGRHYSRDSIILIDEEETSISIDRQGSNKPGEVTLPGLF